MFLGRPKPGFFCVQCGDPVTHEEVMECGQCCLNCEEDFEIRVHRWNMGRDDPALEDLFDMPSTARH